MKKLTCLLVYIFLCACAYPAPDPFSRITVKSQSAVFAKDKNDKTRVHLTYKDDVSVTFADSTTVSSDKLELFARTKRVVQPPVAQPPVTQLPSDVQVEKVVFSKNVSMNRKNQTVKADVIEVFVEEKRCEIVGNVLVEQVKEKNRDVPITTACDRAQLRWDCEEITLVGNERTPVSTTIELGGRARILQKKVKQKSET